MEERGSARGFVDQKARDTIAGVDAKIKSHVELCEFREKVIEKRFEDVDIERNSFAFQVTERFAARATETNRQYDELREAIRSLTTILWSGIGALVLFMGGVIVTLVIK